MVEEAPAAGGKAAAAAAAGQPAVEAAAREAHREGRTDREEHVMNKLRWQVLIRERERGSTGKINT